jgi:4-hydroxythreonine-4-phosphate dehydrogenase
MASNLSTKPLAVSMGEPAGIGPDLILQLFADREALHLPPLLVFGHAGFLRQRADRLGLEVRIAESAPGAPGQDDALSVVDIDGVFADRPGDVQAGSASVVIQAIAQAVEQTLHGACRALVTAPIHKGALYASGFQHPGHTEFLAALCARGGREPLPVMMLAHEELRAVPLTIHVPIADVPRLVTRALIEDTVGVLDHDLRTRFGIAQPRIGISGLNPHAGEGGSIGLEDRDIIAPAIAALQARGIRAEGPFPADTLFYPPHWRSFDAVLAMYHDQALIPIKTVAFESAVNVTLGLPIVRTSPDHGTAFDLAGTGKASASSMLAAIRLADRMSGG